MNDKMTNKIKKIAKYYPISFIISNIGRYHYFNGNYRILCGISEDKNGNIQVIWKDSSPFITMVTEDRFITFKNAKRIYLPSELQIAIKILQNS